jgi:heat shock protein HslJ
MLAGLALMFAAAASAACVPSDRPSQQDRERPAPSSPVGSWRLESLDGAGLGPGRQLVLTLSADGTLSGQLDCNRIGGSWRLEGGARLVTGPVFATQMGCLDAGGPGGEPVLMGLEQGAALTLDGDRMELVARGQTGRFVRIPATAP